MIHKVKQENLFNLKPLFVSNRLSIFVEAILGGILGEAYADDENDPHIAMLAYADIVAIGGDVSHPLAEELIQMLPEEKGVITMPKEWEGKIREVLGPVAVECERFAFDDSDLDLTHLQNIIETLPTEYTLQKIDADLAQKVLDLGEPISLDHVSNYGSIAYFLEHGLGYCIMQGEAIASVASSYASCPSGIEIQINTIEQYKKKGLALIVSAALIHDCLSRGITAHWDAANPTSARLAERLGYTPLGQYEMLLRIPPEYL